MEGANGSDEGLFSDASKYIGLAPVFIRYNSTLWINDVGEWLQLSLELAIGSLQFAVGNSSVIDAGRNFPGAL